MKLHRALEVQPYPQGRVITQIMLFGSPHVTVVIIIIIQNYHSISLNQTIESNVICFLICFIHTTYPMAHPIIF